MRLADDINGFVLAGGKSSRMGQDKAMMELEGKPLVLRAAGILRPLVRDLTILGRRDRYGSLGFPVIEDLWPDQGPLAAICTGLHSSPASWNIFVACDLPRLSPKFLQLLVERVRVTASDAVVPRTEDGWQPLSAAYHSRCGIPFERAFQEGRRSIVAVLEAVRVEAIAQEELAGAGVSEAEFINVNTPEDWTGIERLLPQPN